MPIAEFAALDRVLVIGSFLRKDHPLLAHRLRQAAKKGAQLSICCIRADDDLLMQVAHKAIVAPSALAQALARDRGGRGQAKGKPVPADVAGVEPSDAAKAIAESLAGGERKGDVPRQSCAASSARGAAARAGAGARRADRRDASASSARPRTASAAIVAGAVPRQRRAQRAGDARARRARRICCCTSSPSSIADPAQRARR